MKRLAAPLAAVLALLAWTDPDIIGQVATTSADWATYGGDLASRRYRPFDQINRDNFKDLEVAWRYKTDALGPRPEFNFEVTPLMVNGVLYTTAGTRRAGSPDVAWPTGPMDVKAGSST